MTQPISLRPAQPDDEPFLLCVYASTRQEELACTGWDEDQKRAFLEMQFQAQLRFYREHFRESGYELVLLGDCTIGRIWVHRGACELRVIDMALLPEYRNQGIGGRLMRGVLDEAAQAGKPVRLHVERYNQGAMRLYARLGFIPIGEHGLHIEMECVAGRG